MGWAVRADAGKSVPAGRAPATARGLGKARHAAKGRRASTRAGWGLMGRLEERWRRRQQGGR
jgi:hypothetical protein